MASSSTRVSIQYMSDLHLERVQYKFTIARAAPTLLLGGDIGQFCHYEKYRDFLTTLCNDFDTVLLIAGNHEFYGSSRDEGLNAAMRLTQDPSMNGKLRFLNRDRFDLPDSNVTVLGCTLHSHIAPDYTRLTNDFEQIKGWSVKAHNQEHTKDLEWLKSTLQRTETFEASRKVVIITHYAPMFKGACHPLNENNALCQCFSSTALDQLRRKGLMSMVQFWVFGHTHWNVRKRVGKCYVVSNQRCNEKDRLSRWQKKTLYRPYDSQALLPL